MPLPLAMLAPRADPALPLCPGKGAASRSPGCPAINRTGRDRAVDHRGAGAIVNPAAAAYPAVAAIAAGIALPGAPAPPLPPAAELPYDVQLITVLLPTLQRPPP